jgi:hypothetical protein
MVRPFLAVLAAAVLVGSAVTAPAVKDKKADGPLGPVTDEQLAKSSNNLKQIALAFHNYNDTFGEMPTNARSKDQKPLLSWRVQILPFIEQDHLYKEFKLDEPWDSDHNKKLIDKIPDLYAPVRGKADKGTTFYQVFGGKHGLFKPGGRLTIATIPDGSSNTFLVAESAKPVVWTKPADMEFDGKTVPALGGMFDGRFHAAAGDGSVSRFRSNVPAATLMLWIDPADGMPLPADRGEDADEKN